MTNDTLESISQELYNKSYKELKEITMEDSAYYAVWKEVPVNREPCRTVEKELYRRQKVFYEKENNKLRKCLCQLYTSMDKADDCVVETSGSSDIMWDYDIEQALNDIGVTLYGDSYHGMYDDVLDKVNKELSTAYCDTCDTAFMVESGYETTCIDCLEN